jgi:hypothetical protein
MENAKIQSENQKWVAGKPQIFAFQFVILTLDI